MNDTLPKADWHKRQVAIWVRKVLNFSEQSANVLSDLDVDGLALLAYQKVDELLDDFKESTKQGNISKTSLQKLWAEIEKLKKPGKLYAAFFCAHLQCVPSALHVFSIHSSLLFVVVAPLAYFRT